MSSPAETVNGVFRWLEGALSVRLPTLPFAGAWRAFTALFDLAVDAPLPPPTAPLPWIIPVAGRWTAPLPGLSVSIHDIRIRVARSPTDRP